MFKDTMEDTSDLEFLLLSSHIYQSRDKNLCINSSDLPTLTKWLKDTNRLRELKDIDPEDDIEITFENPRVIDLLNKCNPSINIKFEIESDEDMLILKRLKIKNSSHITYVSEEIPVSIPILHGGNILVTGDVNGDDLLHLIKNTSSSILMTTRIFIDGFMEEDIVREIMDRMIDIVYKKDDSDIFGFSLSYHSNSGMVNQKKVIRGWIIEAGVRSDRSFISVEKSM